MCLVGVILWVGGVFVVWLRLAVGGFASFDFGVVVVVLGC